MNKIVRVTIEFISGERSNYSMNTTQLEEFVQWVENENGTGIFKLNGDSAVMYIFKDAIASIIYLPV